MSVADVAQELNLKERQVYNLIHSSGLPAHYLSPRNIRIRRSELEQWLEERRVNAEGGGE